VQETDSEDTLLQLSFLSGISDLIGTDIRHFDQNGVPLHEMMCDPVIPDSGGTGQSKSSVRICFCVIVAPSPGVIR